MGYPYEFGSNSICFFGLPDFWTEHVILGKKQPVRVTLFPLTFTGQYSKNMAIEHLPSNFIKNFLLNFPFERDFPKGIFKQQLFAKWCLPPILLAGIQFNLHEYSSDISTINPTVIPAIQQLRR